MGAPDYVVVTAYEVKDNASGKVSGIADSIGKGMAAAAASAAAAFDSVIAKVGQLGMAGATLAAGGALYGIKKGLVDVNADLEDSRIGFATLFNMFGASNGMDQGLRMSSDLVEKMRIDARDLPGEFQDFVRMAQTLTSPMLTAGKSMEDIRNMTKDTVVAAAAFKMPFEQASREMAMLLEGRAGAHNILGTRLGITTKTMVAGQSFAAASAAERIQFLNDKLAKAKESIPELKKSWAGLTSNMVDGMKALLGKATLPLFERIKSTVSGLNDLLGGDKAMGIADMVGKYLVGAYDWIGHRVEWIRGHWDYISSTAIKFGETVKSAFEQAWPIVEKIGRYLGEKLQNPGKFFAQLAMMRGGLGLAQYAPNAIGMLGKLGGPAAAASAASKFDGMVGAGAPGGALMEGMSTQTATLLGIGGGGGELAAGGMAAFAPAAAAAAAALLAIGGAIDLLTVNTSTATGALGAMAEKAQSVWAEIKVNMSGAVSQTTSTFGELVEAVRPLADVLGVGLLFVVNNVISTFRFLLWPMQEVAGGLSRLAALLPGYGKDLNVRALPGTSESPTATDTSIEGLANANVKKLKLLQAQRDAADQESNRAKLAAGALAGNGATNITNNNQFTITASDDPERVAMRVATHLDRMSRNPRKAFGMSTYVQE